MIYCEAVYCSLRFIRSKQYLPLHSKIAEAALSPFCERLLPSNQLSSKAYLELVVTLVRNRQSAKRKRDHLGKKMSQSILSPIVAFSSESEVRYLRVVEGRGRPSVTSLAGLSDLELTLLLSG